MSDLRTGNAVVSVCGDLARIELPDWSLESYATFVAVKAALPRYDMVEPFRRHGPARPAVTCAAADLVHLGFDVVQRGGAERSDTEALFPDQRWVLDLALRRARFAVFAEAGWGKTVVQLAFAREACRRTGKPALIVAPLTVVPQTVAEHARFWPGGTQLVEVRGKGGVRAWLDSEPGAAVGIVNTDAFRRGLDLSGLGCLVLDESSILKAMAGVTRNNLVRAVEPVEYRLCCSATPAPNDLEEYVSHALFLGAIRAHKEFFADFFDAKTDDCSWTLRPHAREAFYRFMATWSVWMRRPERYGFPARLGGIPSPVFRDVEVPPTPEQTRAAAPFRKAGNLLLDEVGVVKRSKLAQVARGFLYGPDGAVQRIPSRKPAAVVDAVCSHPGERAIVWVTFDAEGEIIAEALRSRGRLPVVIDGDSTPEQRYAAVCGVNLGEPGDPDVLIAKPATMGFGVNLQGASVVVFSGVGDSFEQDYQALRRAFRYGQTRAVTCYYVVSPFERAMVENVRAKRALWEEQTTAMEDAFADACSGELDAYRNNAKPRDTVAHCALSAVDLSVLQSLGG